MTDIFNIDDDVLTHIDRDFTPANPTEYAHYTDEAKALEAQMYAVKAQLATANNKRRLAATGEASEPTGSESEAAPRFIAERPQLQAVAIRVATAERSGDKTEAAIRQEAWHAVGVETVGEEHATRYRATAPYSEVWNTGSMFWNNSPLMNTQFMQYLKTCRPEQFKLVQGTFTNDDVRAYTKVEAISTAVETINRDFSNDEVRKAFYYLLSNQQATLTELGDLREHLDANTAITQAHQAIHEANGQSDVDAQVLAILAQNPKATVRTIASQVGIGKTKAAELKKRLLAELK